MNFGNALYDFCNKLKIGGSVFCNIEMKYYFEINFDEFDLLNKKGLVFDGSKGGLVLGKLHKNGGIHFLQQSSEEKIRYIGEMEGWEYLTPPINDYNDYQFFEMNELTKNTNAEEDTSFEIPKNCKVIDTRHCEIAFLVVSNKSQFVINRFATRENINLIIELDK